MTVTVEITKRTTTVEVVEKASREYIEQALALLRDRVEPEVWAEIHRLAMPKAGGTARWKGPPDEAMDRLALAALARQIPEDAADDDLTAALAAITRWHKRSGDKKTDREPYRAAGARLTDELRRRGLPISDGCPFAEARTEKATQYRLLKATDEEQVLYVIAIDADTPDSQGEHVPAADARKAAHRWFVESRVVGWNHKEPLKSAEAVESYLVPEGLTQLGDEKVKEGDWIVGVHVRDKAEWEMLKKIGNGSSIGGYRYTGDDE